MPALLGGLRLPDVAREHLRALAEASGETANLAVLHSGEVLYLASESGARLLTLRAGVGLRLPVHCTALGKCLLAQLPPGEARRVAGPEPYAALTPRTLTGWSELERALDRVRRRGVALSSGEFEAASTRSPCPWRGSTRRGRWRSTCRCPARAPGPRCAPSWASGCTTARGRSRRRPGSARGRRRRWRDEHGAPVLARRAVRAAAGAARARSRSRPA